MRVTSTFHLLAPLLLASACARPAAQQPYDLLITGGSVLNGEGTPAVRADVGIRGGRIAAIGNLQTATAARRIDASGLTVAPGFIDMHNHSDYTILVGPEVREHDPAGRDDDGAGRVAIGRTDQAWRRRGARAMRMA